jgi:hypothetical protein
VLRLRSCLGRYKRGAAAQNASAVFGMAECLQKSGDEYKAFKW